MSQPAEEKLVQTLCADLRIVWMLGRPKDRALRFPHNCGKDAVACASQLDERMPFTRISSFPQLRLLLRSLYLL